MSDVLEREGRRPPRPPKEKVRRSARQLLRAAAVRSTHQCPMICGDFAQCQKCGCSSTARDLTSFLNSQCTPMAWSGSVFRPTAAVCVRSRLVDPSHAVAFWPEANVLWCLTCGAYSTQHLRDLGKVCSGRLDKAGAQNLTRISQGKVPGSLVWGKERRERASARDGEGEGERAASAAPRARRVAPFGGAA
eukprot:3974057-Pyramimonas_sp.AAC.1